MRVDIKKIMANTSQRAELCANATNFITSAIDNTPHTTMGGFLNAIPPAYAHQTKATEQILEKHTVLDASEPGTGKSRTALDVIAEYKETQVGNALIFAPKSILVPTWVNDCKKFTPHLSIRVANANNRMATFTKPTDIYVTNHDAAVWCAKHMHVLKAAGIGILVVDESTAYKHSTSARSKAMRILMAGLEPEIRLMLSGTPNINNPLDIWHQVLLLDNGTRLGRNFFKFRQAVCTPAPIPGTQHFRWEPKAEANEVISEMISDIVILNRLEDCADIPPNTVNVLRYTLSPQARAAYTTMAKKARLELGGTEVNAVNAAVLHAKLMQISSGSAYAVDKSSICIDDGRYELVRDLILQRQQCVVAYHWLHQRERLEAIFDEAGITYRAIGGDVSSEKRTAAVKDFNAGDVRVILAHPQSAGHGLTLTAGTTTIWPNPSANAELHVQFNRRIYRNGQTKRTETIVIVADDTIEDASYNRCIDRTLAQTSLLQLLKDNL